MADIVNLNKTRKAAARAARKKKARENRAAGTAARRDADALKQERELDGKRLEPPAKDC